MTRTLIAAIALLSMMAPGSLAVADDTAGSPKAAAESPEGTEPSEVYRWPQAVKTREELLTCGLIGPSWTEWTHDGMKLALALEDWPTSGESYIDVYAYVYNVHFAEWRQFIAVQIRGVGAVELDRGEDSGVLVIRGAANNGLDGKPLLTFDLRAVYDDRGTLRGPGG